MCGVLVLLVVLGIKARVLCVAGKCSAFVFIPVFSFLVSWNNLEKPNKSLMIKKRW